MSPKKIPPNPLDRSPEDYFDLPCLHCLRVDGACTVRIERQKAQVRAAYKELIDAENAHDLKAVAPLVEDSPDALLVAKAPIGWRGYSKPFDDI